MPETPPPPASQPIITEAQATSLASKLNTDGHVDAYGASWTVAVIYMASTDESQRKRLLYLLALYALAIG
jgi:hypothetical protein